MEINEKSFVVLFSPSLVVKTKASPYHGYGPYLVASPESAKFRAIMHRYIEPEIVWPPLKAQEILASMTKEESIEALRILRALAEGKNPFSGADLPEESLYRSLGILPDLRAAVEALEKSAKRKARKLPAEAGKIWSIEEDQALLLEFYKGASLADLAQKHRRTQGAIRSRLMKLGKLPPSSH